MTSFLYTCYRCYHCYKHGIILLQNIPNFIIGELKGVLPSDFFQSWYRLKYLNELGE